MRWIFLYIIQTMDQDCQEDWTVRYYYRLHQYRVYKRILQVDKVVDFRYKNVLLDQNFSFTWSKGPSNIDLKQKNVG